MAKKRIPHLTETAVKVPSSGVLSEKTAPAKERKPHSARARKAKPAAEPAAADSLLSKAAARETSAYPHEEIAKLAYSYWEQRSRQHGHAVEDWLRAERHILNGAVR